jgi:hypothetical protein
MHPDWHWRMELVTELHKVLAQQRLGLVTGASIPILCSPQVLEEAMPLMCLGRVRRVPRCLW